MQNLLHIWKKLMHKNAIKIVWGVKNCALFTKNMALFGEKNCAPFCALFVQKMCAFEFRIISISEQECVDCWRGSRGWPKSLRVRQSVFLKHSVIVSNSQTNASQNASRQRQKSYCDGIYIERCSYTCNKTQSRCRSGCFSSLSS